MLYLIRHADADDAAKDELRPLSHRGHGQVARLAKFLHGSGSMAADEIWHSTLLRARETAERLAEGARLKAPLKEVRGLAPEDAPGLFAQRLVGLEQDLVVVGHNPHLTVLASLLVRGDKGGAAIHFPKCAALALDCMGEGHAGEWTVCWHVVPDLLK